MIALQEREIIPVACIHTGFYHFLRRCDDSGIFVDSVGFLVSHCFSILFLIFNPFLVMSLYANWIPSLDGEGEKVVV